MTDSAKQLDTFYNDYQKVIIDGDASKTEKINAYDAWATGYDEFISVTSMHRLSKITEVFVTALKNNFPDILTLTCLDVGCGTGKPAQMVQEVAQKSGIEVKFTGLDFSPAMLEVCRKKTGVYEELIEADLHETLSLKDEMFDSWLAGGVFLDGHVGPDVIPNIARVVRSGGLGTITIRKKTWDAQREEYEKFFKLSKMEVLSSTVGLYASQGDIEVYAMYIVLRKN